MNSIYHFFSDITDSGYDSLLVAVEDGLINTDTVVDLLVTTTEILLQPSSKI